MKICSHLIVCVLHGLRGEGSDPLGQFVAASAFVVVNVYPPPAHHAFDDSLGKAGGFSFLDV